MNFSELITTAGYAGIFGVIFAESGLLFGVFFPGDSLLFTAGFLASQGVFDPFLLAGLCFVAAVTGDSVGYAFGRRIGRRFFTKLDSFWLNPDQVKRAQDFYAKHGGKTIVLARFVPGVRTLAPILAGVGEMRYSTFLSYNVIGALVWAVGVTLLGYYLGNLIPNVDKYLLLIVALVATISVLPYVIDVVRSPERRKQFRELLQRMRARKG